MRERFKTRTVHRRRRGRTDGRMSEVAERLFEEMSQIPFSTTNVSGVITGIVHSAAATMHLKFLSMVFDRAQNQTLHGGLENIVSALILS